MAHNWPASTRASVPTAAPGFVWISLVGMAASTFVYVNAGTELAHVRELSDIGSPRVLASLAALALLPWLMKPIVRRLQPGTGT